MRSIVISFHLSFLTYFMKLTAELNNEKYEVEITPGDGLNLIAEIDGRVYELETSEPEPNVYLLKHQNKIYQILIADN